MNDVTPEFLARSRQVFKETWPSLEEVRQKVEAEAPTPGRRDTLSAFGALKDRFKIDLTSTPATWPVLRRVFGGKTAAQVGLEEKRYANIRSYIFRAVKEFGVPSPTLTKGPPLSPAWEALLGKVAVKNYRASLKRLGAYCSAMATAPEEVGKEALLGLYEALQAEGGVKDPKIILRHVTSYWNYHLARVKGWPQARLETPFVSNRYRLSLADLPATLQQDIARWRESRLGGDVLSLEKESKKSRLKTVDHHTGQILRYVGLIFSNNLAPLDELTSFRALVEPRLVQATLAILLKEKRRTFGYVHQYAYVLLSIARHYTDLPAEGVKQLARLAANLRGELTAGMTDKNRRLIRQFNRKENVDKLYGFPEAERKRGRKEENSYRQAKFYERALVAELLLNSLLRIENVSRLRIDSNMRKCGKAYILTFSGEEMKNRHDHEIELPEWMTENIDEFVREFRPRLHGSHGNYLFPGELNGARHYSAIRTEFTRTIRKRCGLIVNPHLVRHLGAKRHLDRDPSLLYVVSRQLGHRMIETTQKYYLENDSLSASRMLNRS